MRFFVVPEGGSRPSLVVDVVDSSLDAAEQGRFKETLFGLGCPNGLLFDADDCVLFRDTFSSLVADSIVVETALKTEVVLARAGAGELGARVARWLALLTERWSEALPEAPADAAPLIADVVPAASGSLVHSVASAK